MDEGTSHLDTAIEARVNAAIRGLGLTRIIIAHRPETIATAQRRVAMIDGRLQEVLEPVARSQRNIIAGVTHLTDASADAAVA
jgi:ATP-binding cassette subfamily B protein RaxB